MPKEADPGEAATEVSPTTKAASAATFRLVVVEGQNRGLTFDVTPSSAPRVLVGQSEACAFRLTDPTISRRHVALESQGDAMRVVDLESTNGTFVNELRIYDASLRGGEELRLGASRLRIERHLGKAVPLARLPGFGSMVGYSEAMRRLYPLCEKLARSSLSVVIEGETGTGKEVLAESLHEQSGRAKRPFIIFDCTAVPATLVESELFGHEKGAFTGAITTHRGVFEQANGGTLLVDEIGDLDLALQAKLLRVLERLEVRRVGGDKWIKADVRVLAATRRDLDRDVAAGRFRDDLFHRLNVARIELPPLRARKGDVELLAHYFWRELGGREADLSAETVKRWEDYSWPGNVRELRNAVVRFHALGEANTPDRRAAPDLGEGTPGDPIDRLLAAKLPFVESRERLVAEFERRYVGALLAEHGDTDRAAEASGIGRRYFQKIRARSAR